MSFKTIVEGAMSSDVTVYRIEPKTEVLGQNQKKPETEVFRCLMNCF